MRLSCARIALAGDKFRIARHIRLRRVYPTPNLARIVHHNRVEWTMRCASLAADAQIFINLHVGICAAACYCASRTSDEAERIVAMTAGLGHEPMVEAPAFTHEARYAFVRIGAGAHAVIAMRAAVEIDQHGVFAFMQALGDDLFHACESLMIMKCQRARRGRNLKQR